MLRLYLSNYRLLLSNYKLSMSYPLISYAPTIFAVYPQVYFFASFILFTYYTTFIQVSYIHYDERCHVIQHQHRKEEGIRKDKWLPKRHAFGPTCFLFLLFILTKQLFLVISTTTNDAVSSSTTLQGGPKRHEFGPTGMFFVSFIYTTTKQLF